MVYLELLWVFGKVGLFGFGGGMAIISLIQHEVLSRGWMSEAEFVDIVAISQVTPGPIGMNCATYVGYTATGSIWGSLLASAAMVLPSLVIMTAVCRLYFVAAGKYQDSPYFSNTLRILRLTVLGLIAAAALGLMTPVSFIDYRSWLIFVATALLTLLPEWKRNRWTQLLSHPILLIILAGVVGYWVYS